jgi:MFS family permease
MIVMSFLIQEAKTEFDLDSDFAASALGSVVFVVYARAYRHPSMRPLTGSGLGAQGMWIGLTCFGVLADKKGRRIVYLLSMLTILVFGVLSAFCREYASLLVMRLLVGVGVGGTIRWRCAPSYTHTHTRGPTHGLALTAHITSCRCRSVRRRRGLYHVFRIFAGRQARRLSDLL